MSISAKAGGADLRFAKYDDIPLPYKVVFHFPSTVTRGVIKLLNLAGRTFATIHIENYAREMQRSRHGVVTPHSSPGMVWFRYYFKVTRVP